ncbi:MAG: tol-pal system-associated acyl-CoA thioesterase [Gammaproteobacteria bacterium]|nr:tol-pal system-associated acyl-CoA thioesterase [Gammaproteobacteria bacterium]NNJ91574.1 tol-pal system-associated acyl-CoA thioesterase [Gammaproteobacteria bacterium]
MSEFSWPVRVYYEDTDSGGVVYYANYLKFMERARTELLRSLGFEQDELAQQGLIFAVHRAEVDYIKPARFNNALTVTANITQQKKVSLTFDQEVQNEKGELCSRGKIKIVCLDSESFKPRPIPEVILRAIPNEQ